MARRVYMEGHGTGAGGRLRYRVPRPRQTLRVSASFNVAP